jgi:hypothetical protein
MKKIKIKIKAGDIARRSESIENRNKLMSSSGRRKSKIDEIKVAP